MGTEVVIAVVTEATVVIMEAIIAAKSGSGTLQTAKDFTARCSPFAFWQYQQTLIRSEVQDIHQIAI